MVGLQVAREAARELDPRRIRISALTKREVAEAIDALSKETKGIDIVAAPGDIFIPQSLQGKDRGDVIDKRELFDELFDEIFSSDPETYKRSALFHLIHEHQPDIIVDCINTATAISYQDVFTVSRRTKMLIDALERRDTVGAAELQPLIRSVRELLIAQGIPQITRHILFLHRALEESSVRVYVKVGTTGTGGMGINIPYTHSEDKPSAQLLAKSAVGFAHTGLLFLLARTPADVSDERKHGAMIKEVKPGAMIGFKRLGE